MHSMRRVGSLALLAVVLGVGGNTVPAQGEIRRPKHVLIIRHAEKTGDKTDVHLSKKGAERAEALCRLFNATTSRPTPLPTPDFIFAARNSSSSHRPVETVTPLALKLKLPIDRTYDSKLAKEQPAKAGGMIELRAEVFGNPKYFAKTILVSWRHSTIPELAKTLGAKSVPAKWQDHVFDRVWQLSFDDHGKITFLDRPQRLLPGDVEK